MSLLHRNRDRTARPGRVHRETAQEAGLGTVSPLSIAAGVLSAFGAFAVVAAIVGAVLSQIDVDTEFRTDDFTSSGAVAALASAAVLFVAYLFGGYVAGRMARRAGILHGLLVFVTSIVIGAVVGGVVNAIGDSSEIESNLRSIGMPTTWDQVSDVSAVGAIVSLAAILLGSLVGGMLGERWHTKLARRVADPTIGASAERRERIDQDDAMHRDLTREDRDRDGIDDRDERGIDLRDEDDEPRYTEAEWRSREHGLLHR
jgi:hypothetical protein